MGRYRAPAVLLLAAVLLNLFLLNSQRSVMRDAALNPLCANFFLQQEVEPWKREQTLQMAELAGIGWAKQQFAWEEAEPARDIYNWQKFDELVGLYAQHHMQLVARLDRPPNWTKKDPRFKQGPPDDPADFGDFVFAFVTHFKGRVRYIQVWNEPNLLSEWGGRPPSPAEYLSLLQAAFSRARQADPDVQVLSAPLAPTIEQSPLALDDLLYLARLYDLGAQRYFDILSANAFGQDRPPDDPPSASRLNFRRVELERNIMAAYADTAKPVWINEYGWNASPAYFMLREGALIWQRVSEERQAAYTLRGLQKARSDWPWAGPLCIWYFRQVGNIPPERSDYYFRMVDPDFTPRPLYHALKTYSGNQATP